MRGWPIVRFEDLVLDAHLTLTGVCQALDLTWDDAMLTWPKPIEAVAYSTNANATFTRSIRAGGFAASVLPDRAEWRCDAVPPGEMHWFDRTFSEYNAYHGYPMTMSAPDDTGGSAEVSPPRYEGTKRQRIAAEIQRIQWISDMLKESR